MKDSCDSLVHPDEPTLWDNQRSLGASCSLLIFTTNTACLTIKYLHPSNSNRMISCTWLVSSHSRIGSSIAVIAELITSLRRERSTTRANRVHLGGRLPPPCNTAPKTSVLTDRARTTIFCSQPLHVQIRTGGFP